MHHSGIRRGLVPAGAARPVAPSDRLFSFDGNRLTAVSGVVGIEQRVPQIGRDGVRYTASVPAPVREALPSAQKAGQ